MRFRDLNVGDTFDWIGPEPLLNSFHKRCMKISSRRYRTLTDPAFVAEIGSTYAHVYHVIPRPDTNENDWAAARDARHTGRWDAAKTQARDEFFRARKERS